MPGVPCHCCGATGTCLCRWGKPCAALPTGYTPRFLALHWSASGTASAPGDAIEINTACQTLGDGSSIKAVITGSLFNLLLTAYRHLLQDPALPCRWTADVAGVLTVTHYAAGDCSGAGTVIADTLSLEVTAAAGAADWQPVVRVRLRATGAGVSFDLFDGTVTNPGSTTPGNSDWLYGGPFCWGLVPAFSNDYTDFGAVTATGGTLGKLGKCYVGFVIPTSFPQNCPDCCICWINCGSFNVQSGVICYRRCDGVLHFHATRTGWVYVTDVTASADYLRPRINGAPETWDGGAAWAGASGNRVLVTAGDVLDFDAWTGVAPPVNPADPAIRESINRTGNLPFSEYGYEFLTSCRCKGHPCGPCEWGPADSTTLPATLELAIGGLAGECWLSGGPWTLTNPNATSGPWTFTGSADGVYFTLGVEADATCSKGWAWVLRGSGVGGSGPDSVQYAVTFRICGSDTNCDAVPATGWQFVSCTKASFDDTPLDPPPCCQGATATISDGEGP